MDSAYAPVSYVEVVILHTKLTTSVVQAQQVLDGIQHKVESEIRKGMDCLAHAKAELQVCTPCHTMLHAVCFADVCYPPSMY